MQKLVKFKFRDKTTQTFSLEEAEAIMSSKDQIVMLYDMQGNWTGKSINKSEILGTERDYHEERIETSKKEVPRLLEPKQDDRTVESMGKTLADYKPKFLKNKK